MFPLALRIVLAAAALLIAPATLAQPIAETAVEAGARLKPGQFLWYDDQAQMVPASDDPAFVAPGVVSIVVSIPAQLAYVYRDNELIGISTVSTGSEGRETPVGEFTILQKKEFHRSNLYSNAPMPFMQRLTWDGIALHAGHLPGYPASHGCIRLPRAFARRLFDLTEMGGSVSVVDETVDDPSFNMWNAPILHADARMFGARYEVVTRPGAKPVEPVVLPVVFAPTRPVVQPTRRRK